MWCSNKRWKKADLRERFEGEFPKGTYQLDLESRKARNVDLEIRSILE